MLRDGVDYDTIVFAISLGMVPFTCGELIEDRREWRAMVENVTTTATQAVQVWLREDEQTLGWPHAGTTVSAYEQPLHTWASMPQLIDVECWPEEDRPGAIAYFCGALETAPSRTGPPGAPTSRSAAIASEATRVELLERRLAHLLPGSSAGGSFRWELLCGRNGQSGTGAIDSQFYVANIDPSDRYVQCAPGSDTHRLRADESGYDNLVLAGDWTDNGLNAGCIEAAAISGLQAANAVLGRSRRYRITGPLLS